MSLSVFDIIGPCMVGPSSSHTAGAVRIGLIAHYLFGKAFTDATIQLHGSFAATGKGHATDRAIVAGLLGFQTDDERLKDSLDLATKQGINIQIEEKDLGDDVHPNTARLILTDGKSKETLSICGSSTGGGSIQIIKIGNYSTQLDGSLPTIVIRHQDQTGFLARITAILAAAEVNIATLRTSRKSRSNEALTTIEMDTMLPAVFLQPLQSLKDVYSCKQLPAIL